MGAWAGTECGPEPALHPGGNSMQAVDASMELRADDIWVESRVDALMGSGTNDWHVQAGYFLGVQPSPDDVEEVAVAVVAETSFVLDQGVDLDQGDKGGHPNSALILADSVEVLQNLKAGSARNEDYFQDHHIET